MREIFGPSKSPNRADLVTVDVSFISVAKMLPAVVAAAGPSAEYLILVKPQFELDRGDIGAGGIVRDASLHEQAIERVRAAAVAAGLQRRWRAPEPRDRRGGKSGIFPSRAEEATETAAGVKNAEKCLRDKC